MSHFCTPNEIAKVSEENVSGAYKTHSPNAVRGWWFCGCLAGCSGDFLLAKVKKPTLPSFHDILVPRFANLEPAKNISLTAYPPLLKKFNLKLMSPVEPEVCKESNSIRLPYLNHPSHVLEALVMLNQVCFIRKSLKMCSINVPPGTRLRNTCLSSLWQLVCCITHILPHSTEQAIDLISDQ